MLSHSREVYNLLDLMGDLGGVIEIFIIFFGVFIFPISEHAFTMKAKALEKLFLARTAQKNLFV